MPSCAIGADRGCILSEISEYRIMQYDKIQQPVAVNSPVLQE